jgi:hypothetical protein
MTDDTDTALHNCASWLNFGKMAEEVYWPETEEGGEDRSVDVGDVVVMQEDGVQLVQLGERVLPHNKRTVFPTGKQQRMCSYVSINKVPTTGKEEGTSVTVLPFWPWIRDRFFPNPGFKTHIFDSLMANFWVKSTIILNVFAKKISSPVQK